MLQIDKTQEGNKLTIALAGRLDARTSPEFEQALSGVIDSITELVLDLEGLEYISSAGLRVLLWAQNVMNKQGSMVLLHVNDEIRDVFEVTGLLDILTLR